MKNKKSSWEKSQELLNNNLIMPENNYWLQTKDERGNPFIQFGEYLKQIRVQRKPNLDNVPQMPKNRYGRTYFGHPTFNPFTRGPRFVEDGGNI